MTRENKIFIPHSIINNPNISNYALADYCFLQMLTTTTSYTDHYLSVGVIAAWLSGSTSCNQRFLEHVKSGLYNLEENEIIQIRDDQYRVMHIHCPKMWIDTKRERFTLVTFDEVRAILKHSSNNIFSVLKYFVLLIGTINSNIDVSPKYMDTKNYVVGNTDISELSSKFNIAETTIISYNKILEDEKLIYIYRHTAYIAVDNQGITRLNNVYGRYKDKEYVIDFANSQLKKLEDKIIANKNTKDSNNRRRLAQMYQQLKKGRGEKYSKEEILDVYNYVLQENEKYAALYRQTRLEEHLDNIRDLDLFYKYEFIDTTEEDLKLDELFEVENVDDEIQRVAQKTIGEVIIRENTHHPH